MIVSLLNLTGGWITQCIDFVHVHAQNKFRELAYGPAPIELNAIKLANTLTVDLAPEHTAKSEPAIRFIHTHTEQSLFRDLWNGEQQLHADNAPPKYRRMTAS